MSLSSQDEDQDDDSSDTDEDDDDDDIDADRLMEELDNNIDDDDDDAENGDQDHSPTDEEVIRNKAACYLSQQQTRKQCLSEGAGLHVLKAFGDEGFINSPLCSCLFYCYLILLSDYFKLSPSDCRSSRRQ